MSAWPLAVLVFTAAPVLCLEAGQCFETDMAYTDGSLTDQIPNAGFWTSADFCQRACKDRGFYCSYWTWSESGDSTKAIGPGACWALGETATLQPQVGAVAGPQTCPELITSTTAALTGESVIVSGTAVTSPWPGGADSDVVGDAQQEVVRASTTGPTLAPEALGEAPPAVPVGSGADTASTPAPAQAANQSAAPVVGDGVSASGPSGSSPPAAVNEPSTAVQPPGGDNTLSFLNGTSTTALLAVDKGSHVGQEPVPWWTIMFLLGLLCIFLAVLAFCKYTHSKGEKRSKAAKRKRARGLSSPSLSDNEFPNSRQEPETLEEVTAPLIAHEAASFPGDRGQNNWTKVSKDSGPLPPLPPPVPPPALSSVGYLALAGNSR